MMQSLMPAMPRDARIFKNLITCEPFVKKNGILRRTKGDFAAIVKIPSQMAVVFFPSKNTVNPDPQAPLDSYTAQDLFGSTFWRYKLPWTEKRQ
ncbi:hypothetical protein [Erwinia sp.]|uniref:hypothetical protein n=1 Tax=Erwinia citreus TaxID=558 RepID=UPI002898CABC|nr:hypothetical protein [Erwinia sp.]